MKSVPTHAPAHAGERPGPASRAAWLALCAAFLGWMFDGFEMGLFPLVARPALTDLLGPDHRDGVGLWINVMSAVFLVGAATGGVLFGWLGDRIGRVRAMTLSVLTYALFMGCCGFSRSVLEMMVFRFIASLGMGGEWSLGVALVMEIWPGRSRGWIAGVIGAASNVGFLTIAVVGLGLAKFTASLQGWLTGAGVSAEWANYLVVDSTGAPSGWRLLMVFGAAPAVLTLFIRLMVPESERWLRAEKEGATSHWATRDLLGVLLGVTGPLAMIYLWALEFPLGIRLAGSGAGLAVALAGFMYPVLRYLRRAQQKGAISVATGRATWQRMMLGACLSGVALIGTWASIQNGPSWADQLVDRQMAEASVEARTAARSEARSYTQIMSALGAVLGTILGAMAGDYFGRRPTYAALCLAALLSSLAFFQFNSQYGSQFLLSAFLAGGMTASFYGWLPLYLPELFPTVVRATGQGFSFNFGRVLAAIAALQTGYLMKEVFHDDFSRACSLMSFVYLAGLLLICLAPETKGKPLPD